jgi:hypothetical protein
MNKRITFETIDRSHLDERVINYFQDAGFQFDKTDSKKLRFYKNDSIFEAWKVDPLKWKSEINVTIQNNIVFAEFDIETEAQMFTYEEEKVWNEFIDNFQYFIQQQNIIIKTVKIEQLNKNRKNKFIYLAWTIIGAFTGGLIGLLIARYSESKILVYFCIPVFATLFLKFRINFGRHHNAL